MKAATAAAVLGSVVFRLVVTFFSGVAGEIGEAGQASDATMTEWRARVVASLRPRCFPLVATGDTTGEETSTADPSCITSIIAVCVEFL